MSDRDWYDYKKLGEKWNYGLITPAEVRRLRELEELVAYEARVLGNATVNCG